MPNNIRLLYKNIAKTTGVTASTTSAGYPASNLLTYDKSQVWRATAKTGTLSGSNAALQTASTLHIAHCNFSPTATGRLRLYSDVAKTTLVRDVGGTGGALLCPEPSAEIDGFTAAQAANAYAQGGGAWARLWFPETQFRAWTLDITDTNNLQTTLEASSLFLGSPWSPQYDVEQGAVSMKANDTSAQFRTAAGSLKAHPGIRFDEMKIDLTALTESDRKAMLRLFRSLGKRAPFIVWVWGDDGEASPDYQRETDMAIYGMLTDMAEITLNGSDNFATSLSIAQV